MNINRMTEGSYERQPREPKEKVPPPNLPPYTAYVGNLDYLVTEEQIANFLGPNDIKEVRLIKADGKPKGYAFVEFSTREGLIHALEFDKSSIPGFNRSLTVEVQPQSESRRRDNTSWGPSSGTGYASSFQSRDGPQDRNRERSYDKDGPRDRDYDKGRWGPPEGSSAASSIGTAIQSRQSNFSSERSERKPYTPLGLSPAKEFEPDTRNWRKPPGSEPQPSFQQPQHASVRPQLNLKPRTIPLENPTIQPGKKLSEDPFGGATSSGTNSEDLAKKISEIQFKKDQDSYSKLLIEKDQKIEKIPRTPIEPAKIERSWRAEPKTQQQPQPVQQPTQEHRQKPFS